MNLMLLMRNRPRLLLRSPVQNDFVVYDCVASSAFKSIVDPYEPYYLDIRGHSYHIRPCLRSLFSYIFKRRKRRLYDIYLEHLLGIIKPKLIGTNLDIDARFWVIKSIYPSATTFFVQHGIVDNSVVNQDYLLTNKPEVDWMFTFNDFTSHNFQTNFGIAGQTKSIGSLKNNHVLTRKSTHQESNDLFVVSEWERDISNLEKETLYFIFRCLDKFCKDKKLRLVVLPRYSIEDREFELEHAFYNSFPKLQLHLASKQSDLSNYSNVDNGFGVVFFFSSLGYEIGVRNQIPVVSLSFRAKVEKNEHRVFGWPVELERPIKGVCEEISEKAILETLETLSIGGIDVDIFRRLCVLDEGNRIFRNFLVKQLES